MQRIARSLVVVLLAGTGCGRAPPAPPAAPIAPATSIAAAAPATPGLVTSGTAEKASWQGYGPLLLGSDAAQLRQRGDGELQGAVVAGDGCQMLAPAATGQSSVKFMIEGGRFVRYDVDAADRTAPGGGRVGMTLPQLQALYPQADPPQPHKYVPGGVYLRVAAPDRGVAALVFDIGADGRTSAWRVGVAPQVDYVEGCGWIGTARTCALESPHHRQM
ncbi:MAG: lectin [Stenotrophomonas sp.]